MYKLSKNLAFIMLLAVSLAFTANAQVEKKIVVNSDGSYSVIEYPVGKEVTVHLMPMNGITSTGTARVYRTTNGTKVYVDVAGAPSDWDNVYAYSVDPTGTATLLGPVTISGGAGKGEFVTPNGQFMIVLSPNDDMKMYNSTATNYVLRSEVPEGYTIVPNRMKTTRYETVSSNGMSTTTTTTTTTYDVPMLGVSKFKGRTSELKLNFGGDLSGLQAKAYLKPYGGKTQIKMKFSDLQKAPMNKRFVLWTSSPEGYTKIGQIVHAGKKDTAEIIGETALNDFGLFLTVEDVDVMSPTSRIYSTFTWVQ